MATDEFVPGDQAGPMKASRVGRRALRGGRHAARAVTRRKMPIAAFGVLAATVVGLGALTAADIHSINQFGNGPVPFGSHQHFQHPGQGPQFPGLRPFDPQFHQIPNAQPPGGQ